MATFRLASVNKLHEYALSGSSGKDWYSTTRAALRTLCEARGLDYDLFIYIMSATSSRSRVWMNIRHAIRVSEAIKAGVPPEQAVEGIGLMLSVRKVTVNVVYAYQQGESPLVYLGPKTGNFAQNLLGNEEPITLDTWMAQLIGIPASKSQMVTKPRVATRYKQRIRTVARRLGWTPAQTQAALWLHAATTLGKAGHGEQDIQSAIDKAVARL